MPAWLEVLLIVIVALVVVLFALGAAGAARRRRELENRFGAQLEEANRALAAARAADRGWERATIEAAARAVHERAHPGTQIRELHLVQVVDRPGTTEDEARFRVVDDHGVHDVVLGRRDDEWIELAG
ncbi:MAG: hypothetical protein E6G10_03170 [Actinobacteria bacterium]|nr:MAG: hypothetical protein E6G10_03170 [Actinomycetota bacterium]